jgi:hypothetical protein
MTGKHRRPQRSASRNLAATAAVLAAGALPLAAAGSAFADTAPAGQSPLSAPSLSQAPLGLGAAASPVDGAVPLAGTIAGAATSPLGSGELPTGGLLTTNSAQTQARETATANRAANEAADLATRTSQTAGQLAGELPVAGFMDELAPAMPAAPMQVAPYLLQDGTVGTLADGFGGRATDLADRAVGQMRPVLSQLHPQAAPTVGDVTSTLSQADMPVFGTVGNFTSMIPVSQLAGGQNPAFGAVDAASAL